MDGTQRGQDKPAASRRRAAWTRQGQWRAESAQQGQDRGARGEQIGVEKRVVLLLENLGNKLLREKEKGRRRKERKKWAMAPFQDICRPYDVTPHSILPLGVTPHCFLLLGVTPHSFLPHY